MFQPSQSGNITRSINLCTPCNRSELEVDKPSQSAAPRSSVLGSGGSQIIYTLNQLQKKSDLFSYQDWQILSQVYDEFSYQDWQFCFK